MGRERGGRKTECVQNILIQIYKTQSVVHQSISLREKLPHKNTIFSDRKTNFI